MAFFEQDYLDFFKELAANNHKDWFDTNRKRYEKVVKKPFAEFVSHMINKMNENGEEIKSTPKTAIFRINRDIRFSKDKAPYKMHMSAILSAKEGKNATYPGLYFELSPEKITVCGGIYEMDKETLHKVRNFLALHQQEFTKLINEKAFVNTLGGLQGEKNVRVEKELKSVTELEPAILNKQFYYAAKLDSETIISPHLDTEILKLHSLAKSFNSLLVSALEV